MDISAQAFIFEQIHIEIARNASDDFNLFHDKNKWQQIHRNPFEGPIVLGFQLEALIEREVEIRRRSQEERAIIDQYKLQFSNYELTFASVIKPHCEACIEVKPARLKLAENTTLSRRICIKTGQKIALIGYKKESQSPLYLAEARLPQAEVIESAADRSYLADTNFFLKRKFMNTSNAKNFLTGSLVEQADYFDELEDIARFPEIFPCSLISNALLERAMHWGHNFERNPMIYTSHKICIDRRALNTLHSNDALHILVQPRHQENEEAQTPESAPHSYECYGILKDGVILFRAIIDLIPLAAIINHN